MTQPGVSQHIKSLEKELNTVLLLRNGKKVNLSLSGERLRLYAEEQFRAERNFRENLHKDTLDAGEIKISCSGSMAILLYPELLDLQSKFPKLRVCLEAAPNSKSIQQIKQDESDIALITSHIDDPDLALKKIGSEQLCILLPKGHTSSWANLLELGYINHPNGAHYASQLFELNYPDRFNGFNNFPISGYVNQINQILLPVSKGLGFTVLPESTLKQYPDRNLIETGKIDKACEETVYLVTKKYKTLPKRYNQVLEILQNLWSH